MHHTWYQPQQQTHIQYEGNIQEIFTFANKKTGTQTWKTPYRQTTFKIPTNAARGGRRAIAGIHRLTMKVNWSPSRL